VCASYVFWLSDHLLAGLPTLPFLRKLPDFKAYITRVRIFNETLEMFLTMNDTDRRVDTQFMSFHTFLMGGKRQNCVLALIGDGTVLKIAFLRTSCTSVLTVWPSISRAANSPYFCGSFPNSRPILRVYGFLTKLLPLSTCVSRIHPTV